MSQVPAAKTRVSSNQHRHATPSASLIRLSENCRIVYHRQPMWFRRCGKKGDTVRTLIIWTLLAVSGLAQVPTTPDEFPADARQISVEVRMISAPQTLLARLKASGLIRTPPPKPELQIPEVSDDALQRSGGIQLVSATRTTERRESVFTEKLTDDRVRSILKLAQQSQRANILFAPKVTLFDGQEGFINDVTERPFVVGIKTAKTPEAPEQPDIRSVREGTQIGLRTRVVDNTVRLDVVVHLSTIDDVNVEAGNDGVNVQVPTVTSLDVRLGALLATGETLAVCGFETNPEVRVAAVPVLNRVPYVSKLFRPTVTEPPTEMLVLITPRILNDQK